MASREGAFDFLEVLQKNHGAKKRYDRHSTFGSDGSQVVPADEGRSADLAWIKNDDF
jgi:hypothetical protein